MLSSLRRLLPDAWLLFLLSRQVSWNSFRSRSLGSQILLIVFVLAFGAVTGGGSFALGLGVGEILRFYPQLHLEPLIPGVLLAGSSVILLVFSFGAVLGSLFLAKDLDLLMSAPVDRRAIFLAKILDSQGLYYVILAIAAAPALTAYGMRLQYGAGYFVLAMIALLGTPLLPAGVAALLVMVVVRYAPARRVRETLGLAAAAIGIGFSVLAQTARLWTRQFASLEQTGSLSDMPGILTLLQHMLVTPIPPLMAGKGLVAAGQGQWLPALALLSAFLVSTFGLFIISVIAAERLYVSGWVRLQGSGSARRAPSRSGQANDWLAQAPATLAVALKDWRVFPRDLLGLRQLLAPLVAVPVIYYNLVGGSGR
ncbi:MAG TPA: hypothetical protein VGW38_20355, partial [Chloroflexota bacterium]|nr:hypothetical protein [Chloroflexota bacterium]